MWKIEEIYKMRKNEIVIKRQADIHDELTANQVMQQWILESKMLNITCYLLLCNGKEVYKINID